MRLLLKKEADAGKKADINAEASRLSLIRRTVIEETKALNEWRSVKEAEIAAVIEKLTMTDQEYELRLKELKNEVQVLESRRREALKPIDERRRALDERENLLKNRESTHLERESTHLAAEDDLFLRKTVIADEESELRDKLEDLKRQQHGTMLQAASVVKSNEVLNERMRLWSERVAEKEAGFTVQAAEISGREAIIAADKEFIQKTKESLAKERLTIASERAALAAAFEEGRKKRYI